jgi:hypothetical protein
MDRLQEEKNMKGATTDVVTSIQAPREWFFYWFLSVDLHRIMHRYAILPAVIATSDQTGPMDKTGSKRVIRFSDGSTAVEEILESDPPGRIIYRVGELTSMFRFLIKEGRAQILFHQNTPSETTVEWRYTFYGHNWFATLLLKPLISILWRGFMRSALHRARQLAEHELSVHPL